MRTPRFILCVLLAIPLSYVIGFFVAGAIVFPVDQPFYRGRVLITLGWMGFVYGVESVMFRGHFETQLRSRWMAMDCGLVPHLAHCRDLVRV
jgi:hypothetical protein